MFKAMPKITTKGQLKNVISIFTTYKQDSEHKSVVFWNVCGKWSINWWVIRLSGMEVFSLKNEKVITPTNYVWINAP